MPEISRFYGIVIRMYFGDHNPPHFHVEYEGNEALISIHTLGVIVGQLPPRAMGMVAEWAATHRDELLADWVKASNLEPPEKIAPLP
ncbi:MAG: DUF4160 domain-containing protein [Betaproteobacteria bacterium]|nr:DUF4160 domain-containing protein [Betaproteobacteria bacterium]